MGSYIYKTAPTARGYVTIELADGHEQVNIEIQFYKFAYKPWHHWQFDKKFHNQQIEPALRAFDKKGAKPLAWGTLKFQGKPAIGDTVFETAQQVFFNDEEFFNSSTYQEIGKIVAIGKEKKVA